MIKMCRSKFFSLLFCCLIANTVHGKLVVVYPSVPAPFDQIFNEILEGIDTNHAGDIALKAITKKDSTEEVLEWIENIDSSMVIALGRSGYEVAKGLDDNIPAVVGALPIKPNGVSGVSLIGDPKLLFDALSVLAPQINTVHVVYSPANEWLINLAQERANSMGLHLNMLKATDIKVAVKMYGELLDKLNVDEEALWLPLDPVTANEQVILPNLLKRSWEKNVVLFSSKPAHARRGALFSMYPDHNKLGSELVKMVTAMQQTQSDAGVIPLGDMKLAVNLRTAAHLGFNYKNQQKSQFHLTFP